MHNVHAELHDVHDEITQYQHTLHHDRMLYTLYIGLLLHVGIVGLMAIFTTYMMKI